MPGISTSREDVRPVRFERMQGLDTVLSLRADGQLGSDLHQHSLEHIAKNGLVLGDDCCDCLHGPPARSPAQLVQARLMRIFSDCGAYFILDADVPCLICLYSLSESGSIG